MPTNAAVTAHFVGAGRALRMVRIDAAVFTGEGEDLLCQRFASARDAEAHLELVLTRHRRAGRPISTRTLAPDELAALQPPVEVPDDLADCLTWDDEQARLFVSLGDAADVARCDEIVARAHAREVTFLQVLCDPASPGAALSSALRRRPLPLLHTLAFDHECRPLAHQRGHDPGPLDELLAGLPALERLFASGDLELRPCEHSSLCELYLLGDPLRADSIAALGRCRFARLDQLGLVLASDAAPAPARLLVAALRELDAPVLRELEIDGAADVVELLDLLTARPLPESWHSLRIRGRVHDEHALLALLAARSTIFASLGELGLPLELLSRQSVTTAHSLVPELRDADDLPIALGPHLYLGE